MRRTLKPAFPNEPKFDKEGTQAEQQAKELEAEKCPEPEVAEPRGVGSMECDGTNIPSQKTPTNRWQSSQIPRQEWTL
jgi:hypothetical protein